MALVVRQSEATTTSIAGSGSPALVTVHRAREAGVAGEEEASGAVKTGAARAASAAVGNSTGIGVVDSVGLGLGGLGGRSGLSVGVGGRLLRRRASLLTAEARRVGTGVVHRREPGIANLASRKIRALSAACQTLLAATVGEEEAIHAACAGVGVTSRTEWENSAVGVLFVTQ